jgi:hypothetical protein
VLQLAACVTLPDGCDAAAANALVEEERPAFGVSTPLNDEQMAGFLHDALAPPAGSGADAVRPDLIGEAFLLREVGRDGRSPASLSC